MRSTRCLRIWMAFRCLLRSPIWARARGSRLLALSWRWSGCSSSWWWVSSGIPCSGCARPRAGGAGSKRRRKAESPRSWRTAIRRRTGSSTAWPLPQFPFRGRWRTWKIASTPGASPTSKSNARCSSPPCRAPAPHSCSRRCVRRALSSRTPTGTCRSCSSRSFGTRFPAAFASGGAASNAPTATG